MKNNLKVFRAESNISQDRLAKKVHVSRQTIISIEGGRYIPSTLLALKIANTLSKSLDEIFVLEESDFTYRT